MPPALAIAVWFCSDLFASCVIAETEFSLALAESLSSSASSGAMPPASTIDARLSIESRARLASAAAACSCAAVPLSCSMLTSCLMMRTRFLFSIERRTSAPPPRARARARCCSRAAPPAGRCRRSR